MKHTIYYAAGIPGSGKTENLLSRAMDMAHNAKNLIIATPTKSLCKELGERLINKGIKHTVIIGEEETTEIYVQPIIEEKISTSENEIFIITHTALFMIDTNTLTDSIIVIDETPNLIEFEKISMKNNEWDRIFRHTKIDSNILLMTDGEEDEIREKNNRYKSDKKNSDTKKSALSKNEHIIFDALINKKTVTIKKGKSETQAQVINTKNLETLTEITTKAKEVHLLAANITGGLFETLISAMGITIKSSPLESRAHTYNKNIKIYTIFQTTPSKSKLLTSRTGEIFTTHRQEKAFQNIDLAWLAFITHAPDIYPFKKLLFTNKWARFEKHDARTTILSSECRGLNQYSDHNIAACFFHGNPSPMDVQCLGIIAKKLDITYTQLRTAWKVTHKLEKTLQCVTRTSIRDNRKECKFKSKFICAKECQCQDTIYLYVQDIETANYLKETCMPHAIINRTLELEFFKPLKTSKQNQKKKSALEVIMNNKLKSKKTILESLINSGMSKATAYRYYNKMGHQLES